MKRSITTLAENELVLISGGDGEGIDDATEELKEAAEDLREAAEDFKESASYLGTVYKMTQDFFSVFGLGDKATAALSAGSIFLGGIGFIYWKNKRVKPKTA